MVQEYFAWDLLNLEQRVQHLERYIERKEWRDNHDPFNLHDDEFIKLYRVSLDIVTESNEILL